MIEKIKEYLQPSKKGNVDILVSIALGLVVFAVIVGAGVYMLNEFGDATGGSANTTVQALITELGTTGLVGWVPAIVAVLIGAFFIALLSGGFGRSRGRKY